MRAPGMVGRDRWELRWGAPCHRRCDARFRFAANHHAATTTRGFGRKPRTIGLTPIRRRLKI